MITNLPLQHTGYDVYHSEEFKALCRYLGIPWDGRTTTIKLTIPHDGRVTVEHTYYVPQSIPTGLIDTTDIHNKRFRTFTPSHSKREEPNER